MFDDAADTAIREMERAGLDIITDGEGAKATLAPSGSGCLGRGPRQRDIRSRLRRWPGTRPPAGAAGTALSAIVGQRTQALVLQGANPVTFSNRARIVHSTQKNRLPSMYPNRVFVDAGGLMPYGPSGVDLARRAATYVNKIKEPLPSAWTT
jgi:hypothetical protein